MSATFQSALSFVLAGLWRATWQATLLAGVVLILQHVLGKRLGGRGRFALWAIVVVRLLLPVLPESRFSIFNLSRAAPKPAPQSLQIDPVEAQIPIIVIGPGTAKPQAVLPGPAAIANNVASSPAKPINWSTWIFAAWIAGVFTLALRVAQVCWELSLTIRSLNIVSDPAIVEIVESCARTLRLRRIPRVLAGGTVQTPAVVGLFGPKLLLPADVLSRCDAREIRLIVLHELAHLKRHDIAGNWLIAVASVVHWFNPIVWLLSARMRADRELACDELVLAHSSGEAHAYGQTLVKLIEILSPSMRSFSVSPRQLAIVGILESTTPMQRRVRMIAQFDPKQSLKQSRRWIWTAAVLVLLAAFALTDAVHGENKTHTSPSSTQPSTRPAALVNGAADAAPVDAPPVDTQLQAYDVQNLLVPTDGSSREQMVEHLVKLIEDFASPETWQDNGGSVGTIREYNGKLLVQNTAAAQSKIADLLKMLATDQPALALAPTPTPGGGVLALAGAAAPVAPQQAIPHTVVSDEEIEAANKQAMQVLKKKLPDVKFDSMPLSDVIDFYRDTTGANLFVNWQTLEAAGIDRSAQVSLRLKDSSFETVLTATLRQVSAQILAVVIDRGVITITTRDDLAGYMLTKTYDVKNLAESPNDMTSLCAVLQSLTGPQEGGGTVQFFGTKLVITATPGAHEQVQKLLAELSSGKPTTRATQ